MGIEEEPEWGERLPRNSYVPPEPPKKVAELPPMEVLPPAAWPDTSESITIEGYWDSPLENLPPAGLSAAQTYYNSPYQTAVISGGMEPLNPKPGTVKVWTQSDGWQVVDTTIAYPPSGFTLSTVGSPPAINGTFTTDYTFTLDDVVKATKGPGSFLKVGTDVSLDEAEKLVANGAEKLSTKEKIKYLFDKAIQIEKEAGPNPTSKQVDQIKSLLAEVDSLEMQLDKEEVGWNLKKSATTI